MLTPIERDSRLLTVSELARELRRSHGYVYAMRRRGFVMPADLATLGDALAWLRANPKPCAGICTGRRKNAKALAGAEAGARR